MSGFKFRIGSKARVSFSVKLKANVRVRVREELA